MSGLTGGSCHRRAVPKPSCAWRTIPACAPTRSFNFESLGYKVLAASNAAEALAIADAGAEFDLLFTDIVMPGKLNGRQLAEAMV